MKKVKLKEEIIGLQQGHILSCSNVVASRLIRQKKAVIVKDKKNKIDPSSEDILDK